MIKEFERFHGAVFARILHGAEKIVSLRLFSADSNSSYVVNEAIGIYIKYSGKRMSPWRFSFAREHQAEITKLREQLSKVFIVFVCGTDGIVALSHTDLRNILDDVHDESEWVSIGRTARKMYLVRGSNGTLPFKTGKKDFPQSLFG